MRSITGLVCVAIVAAVSIALASHEKSGADSDRDRSDTWQTWRATTDWNYRQLYPTFFMPEQLHRPVRLVAVPRKPLPKPKLATVPLPRPRPKIVPVPEHVASRHLSPLETLFGGF